ncbi:hypothetical protein GRAN_1323 [Granulicella sibirica]|uniref:Uncharacterized protein n=1 Tax=Granulicella sibirica TaxID=2479048 RepID=A0A4Q0T352_9BACT|nr:hypothetical protein GRAN_1323 [Granulicella sibirica]
MGAGARGRGHLDGGVAGLTQIYRAGQKENKEREKQGQFNEALAVLLRAERADRGTTWHG